MEPLRKCTMCGEEAWTRDDLDIFVKDSSYKYGRKNRCKKCSSKRVQDWRKNNKWELHRGDKHYMDRYNITKNEYEKCMQTSNVCEVCGSTNKLCYDHNHDTMEFRGVLCWNCNSALGKFGDSLEGILRVIKYLEGK